MIITYAASFVVLLAVLVAVHEFGHYYAAKTIGVRATEFAVGFGPVLLSRTDRSGCRWQLRLYPLGGFVRFRGDADPASASPAAGLAESARGMAEAERRTFLHLRGPGDRAFVLLAGPGASVLFGMALLGAVYVGHGRSVTPPVVAQVLPGHPAAAAGFEPGDRIVSVDGSAVRWFDEASLAFERSPGRRLDVVVSRAGAERTLSVVPETTEKESFGSRRRVGAIGIVSGPRVLGRVGPVEGLWEGVGAAWAITREVVGSVGRIVVGRLSVKEMGGPVRIAQMSGNAATQGFLPFLVLMAAMSINLGVFNLFPLPILDGGQLVVCLIECVTKRPVRERTMAWVNSVGFALLVALFVSVTVSDISQVLSAS